MIGLHRCRLKGRGAGKSSHWKCNADHKIRHPPSSDDPHHFHISPELECDWKRQSPAIEHGRLAPKRNSSYPILESRIREQERSKFRMRIFLLPIMVGIHHNSCFRYLSAENESPAVKPRVFSPNKRPWSPKYSLPSADLGLVLRFQTEPLEKRCMHHPSRLPQKIRGQFSPTQFNSNESQPTITQHFSKTTHLHDLDGHHKSSGRVVSSNGGRCRCSRRRG